MADIRDVHWGVERLTWAGSLRFTNQLRRTSEGLFRMIAEKPQPPPQVTLDFSRCTFTTEKIMLPLLPLVTYYREVYSVPFELVLPEDDTLARLFRNTNWAHYLDPDNFDDGDQQYARGHVPALHFSNDDDETHEPIRRRVLDLVASSANVDPTHLDAFDYALKEIMENVPAHAKSQVGGFLQATKYPTRNEVEFIIADAGCGIPSSLGYNDKDNGEEALRAAIEHGVTRDKERFYGNGLDVTYQLAAQSGGTFEINSNYSYLVLDRYQRTLRTETAQFPFWGTIIRCGIGLDDPDILPRVLEANQPAAVVRPTDPVIGNSEHNDGEEAEPQVEHELVSEHPRRVAFGDNPIVISVRGSVASTGVTPASAAQLRAQVVAMLDVIPVLALDFDGVEDVSTEFAHEIFYKLFSELGATRFISSVQILHIDRHVLDTALRGEPDRQ